MFRQALSPARRLSSADDGLDTVSVRGVSLVDRLLTVPSIRAPRQPPLNEEPLMSDPATTEPQPTSWQWTRRTSGRGSFATGPTTMRKNVTEDFRPPQPLVAAALPLPPASLLLALGLSGLLPVSIAVGGFGFLVLLALVRGGLAAHELHRARQLGDALLRAYPGLPPAASLAAWRSAELTSPHNRRRLTGFVRQLRRETEACTRSGVWLADSAHACRQRTLEESLIVLHRLECFFARPSPFQRSECSTSTSLPPAAPVPSTSRNGRPPYPPRSPRRWQPSNRHERAGWAACRRPCSPPPLLTKSRASFVQGFGGPASAFMHRRGADPTKHAARASSALENVVGGTYTSLPTSLVPRLDYAAKC